MSSEKHHSIPHHFDIASSPKVPEGDVRIIGGGAISFLGLDDGKQWDVGRLPLTQPILVNGRNEIIVFLKKNLGVPQL